MDFHITKMHLFLGQYFLHFSGHIQQIYTHNKMSYVFNLSLITPLNTSLHIGFPSFLSFH